MLVGAPEYVPPTSFVRTGRAEVLSGATLASPIPTRIYELFGPFGGCAGAPGQSNFGSAAAGGRPVPGHGLADFAVRAYVRGFVSVFDGAPALDEDLRVRDAGPRRRALAARERRERPDRAHRVHKAALRLVRPDGVLVDLTGWATDLGFRDPVACTQAVWADYLVPPSSASDGHGQSERGRTHDLLWMLRVAIQTLREEPANGRMPFDVQFVMDTDRTETVTLHAHRGPGDQGEPVLTVMMPHED